MPGKLTAIAVAKQQKPGRYGDGGGLWLQVSQWQTKCWVFRYTKDGRAHHMGLGDLQTFTLAEARQRARRARQQLADGLDPLEEKRRARQAGQLEAARSISFRDAAEKYIDAHRPSWTNAKHAAQWESSLAAYAYPVFGHLPVAEIDTGLLLQMLEPIWATKTETASRVRGRIESILDWATVRNYRQGPNPARWKGHLQMTFPAKNKVAKIKHFAALPYAELPGFMAELREADTVAARALEFCILTAARTGETREARWDEIDFDEQLWTIPPSRTKSGRPHRVPLSGRVLEVLNAVPREHGSEFVFPGTRHGRPISELVMLLLLRCMRGRFTVHGMRSTFRDWAAEQTNYPDRLAEAALGHVLQDATQAAYQRGDLLAKRRRLMAAWTEYCAKPVGSGDVVSMAKAWS